MVKRSKRQADQNGAQNYCVTNFENLHFTLKICYKTSQLQVEKNMSNKGEAENFELTRFQNTDREMLAKEGGQI